MPSSMIVLGKLHPPSRYLLGSCTQDIYMLLRLCLNFCPSRKIFTCKMNALLLVASGISSPIHYKDSL